MVNTSQEKKFKKSNPTMHAYIISGFHTVYLCSTKDVDDADVDFVVAVVESIRTASGCTCEDCVVARLVVSTRILVMQMTRRQVMP